MEMLRIKCPACGIILEVKNSKHEAVKKITCPNCKKQLAVTFADNPKPSIKPQPIGHLYEEQTAIQLFEGVNPVPHVASGLVELRVLRLADGSCKHILRALTAEKKVLVNGQPLQQEDEVVLSRGDELEIDLQHFTFNKPGKTQLPPTPPVEKTEPSMPELPESNHRIWLILAGIVVILGVLWWAVSALHHPEMTMLRDLDTAFVKKDTVKPAKTTKQEPKETLKAKDPKKTEPLSEQKSDMTSMSLYSLELQANKNDVDAQYELGKRLVHSSGSKNIIMGINWLRKASRNGSSQARQTMNKALNSLKNKAAQGDSVAIYILNSIEH